MMILATSADQTIPVGGSIVFDRTIFKMGECPCHKSYSPILKLVKRGTYSIEFHGNVGSNTADTDASVSLQDTGTTLPAATAISATQAAGDLNNVSIKTILHNCCGVYGAITVVNTGTTPLNVAAGAEIIVQEV